MLDAARLRTDLSGFANEHWISCLLADARRALADGAHGDLPRWRAALQSMPSTSKSHLRISRGAVTVEPGMDPAARVQVREQLLSLAPWRKGPFRIDDILIDAEWRSDMKWQRLQDAIAPLSGRRVLDVGCGNGYYALRMRLAGADLVIGTDPTLLFLVQFAAVTRFAVTQPVHLLPLRLQQLPPAGPEFDSTFSMGVLYHQRDPREHLQQLRETLRPGGELVLETLIAPGTESAVLVPGGRYARMRNVWHLPTGPRLVGWLESSGFRNSRFIDTGNTTIHEQRSTEWMPFESLQQALGRDDPTATVEGLPAPRRALLTAQRA